MNTSISFETESVPLQNRLGRLINVELSCFTHGARYCVILNSTADFPARQMSKSAEHLAYQIILRLGVNPNDVDFVQYQPGEQPEWLRWRFQWVGQSPLHGKSSPVNAGFEERFIKPLMSRGQRFSLMSGKVPAVA